MEISVFLQGQNHAQDTASHRSSRIVMKMVLAAALAEQIGQNAIQLTTPLSWKEVKAFARLALNRPLPASDRSYYNGPLGRGNLLPFARRTTGDPLHYSVPMAGDVGLRRHNLFRRTDKSGVARLHGKLISASTRNIFARHAQAELFPVFALPKLIAATAQ
jgi:hypothetical protein